MAKASQTAKKQGIFYGWWIIASCASVVAVAGGTFFFGFGTIFNPVIREFGWSRAVTSIAFSIRAEVGGIEAPVVGYLLDRFGPRRIMLIGVILVGLGIMVVSWTNSLWTFYLGFFIATAGTGACSMPVGMMVTSNWFERKRGIALGLLTTGGSLGGTMVVVLAWLVEALGWRMALRVITIAILLICVPLTFVVRRRPEEMGLRPDGEPALDLGMRGGEAGPTSGDPESPAIESETSAYQERPRGSAQDKGYSAKEALRSKNFWLLSFAVAFAFLSSQAIIVHQIPYLISIGIPPELAAISVTAMAYTSILGRVGLGWLADSVDKRYILAGAIALQGIGVLILAGVQGLWSILLYLLVYSPGFGGGVPVRAALQGEYFGRKAFGTIQGLLLTVVTLGAALGPFVAGWVFDITGSYRPALVILGALTFVGAALTLLLRPETAERQGVERSTVEEAGG